MDLQKFITNTLNRVSGYNGIRMPDTFIIQDGNQSVNADAWLAEHRPGLLEIYGTAKTLHNELATSRWLFVKRSREADEQDVVLLERVDGELDSDYNLGWITIKVVEESESIGCINNIINSGKYIQLYGITKNDKLIATDGRRRKFAFSSGNYPCGDYKEVTDLEPIPSDELWLWNNLEVRESLENGLKDAKEGLLYDLGSFAKSTY